MFANMSNIFRNTVARGCANRFFPQLQQAEKVGFYGGLQLGGLSMAGAGLMGMGFYHLNQPVPPVPEPTEKTVALIGTAGDPFHIGHLVMAENILRAGGVDEVWYIPSGMRQDKPGLTTSVADRIAIGQAMVPELRELGFRHTQQIKLCNMEAPECGVSQSIPSLWLYKKMTNTYNHYSVDGENPQAQPLEGKLLEALHPQPIQNCRYVFFWTCGTDCMNDIRAKWTDALPTARLTDGKWLMSDGVEQTQHPDFEHKYGDMCFQDMRWICVPRKGYNNTWWDAARSKLAKDAIGLHKIGGLCDGEIGDQVPPQAYITITNDDDEFPPLMASSSAVKKLLKEAQKNIDDGLSGPDLPSTLAAYLTQASFRIVCEKSLYGMKPPRGGAYDGVALVLMMA